MQSDAVARILKGRKTGIRHILDSAHTSIEAINEDGKTIWKTDPWKDNKLPAYGPKQDGNFNFIKTLKKGHIDLITGKFNFVLQL